jgi:uncharacterized membrane protein YdjX (TVP38/TMEM64 family)
MKKKLIIFIIVSFCLICLFYIADFDKFKIIKFFEIKNYKNEYFFYILLFLSSIILFLTPFPATIILIINGYYFGFFGNFVSLFFILFSASILFFLSQSLIKKKVNFLKKYQKYNHLFDKNKLNLLFGLRFLIPHFFHSLICGLIKINFYKFFIIITLAEIPGIFFINTIGNSIKNFTEISNKNFESIFFDSNFFTPFFSIIIIYIIYRYFEKKINLQIKNKF